MIGLEFNFPDELLEEIKAEFQNIRRQILEKVSKSWIVGIQKYSDNEDAYFQEE
jgi:hypothetical protein